MSSRGESCRLFKPFFTKSQPVDSTISNDDSCRLVASRHNLTTFYRPFCAKSLHCILPSLTQSTQLFQMTTRDGSSITLLSLLTANAKPISCKRHREVTCNFQLTSRLQSYMTQLTLGVLDNPRKHWLAL